ncbi:MAG: sel1 repeat family protein, partial [Candidatus Methanomethylophilus sp.]|nr:sel1 repeat family protein [Methanomethylophilus sp.]
MSCPETFDDAQRNVYERAEGGDAEAMFLLASFYHNGDNVPVSETEAFAWCRKAAEAGSVNAMNNLGSLYGSGVGVK